MDQYLRIDTTDLGTPSDEGYIHSGLLTPLPSATEGRRGSIASSECWGFGSYPGSVSSVETTQGPSTPRGADNGLSNSYCVVNPGLSFSSFTLSQQSQVLDSKSSFDSVPVATPQTPVTPVEDFSAQQETEWIWIRGSETNVPSSVAYQDLSTTGSFGSSFGPSLPFTAQEDPAQFCTSTGPGNPSGYYFSTCDSWKEPDIFYGSAQAPTEISQFNGLPNIPIDQLRQPFSLPGGMVAEHGSTIAPSATFVEHSPLQVDPSPSSGHRLRFADLSRTASPEPFMDVDMKSDDDPDFTPSFRRSGKGTTHSMYESPTGGKRAKREKRRRSLPRKHREARQVTGYLPGAEGTKIAVTIDNNVNGDRTGKVPKKHPCGAMLPDGSRCLKAFARIEHHRRHIYTHTGKREFHCDVPGCKKSWFSRNDNLQEHYKTHLGHSKVGRNTRICFEEMYKLIKENKTVDQAKKSIMTLEKWRKSKAHEEKDSKGR
ncbi:hypothetical protein NA57DRAFT_70373 [Rhizodiscina lignyota]|uniref:C2H2-type domain-containing protein n=1 Tax=Rhizodiscina lignyota TaxID=1504668 RepID=A0A9P4IN38_9PEZI|nr:hypothetical protein NA57DRAFT_70373 [Rhizodiscina lignyota]